MSTALKVILWPWVSRVLYTRLVHRWQKADLSLLPWKSWPKGSPFLKFDYDCNFMRVRFSLIYHWIITFSWYFTLRVPWLLITSNIFWFFVLVIIHPNYSIVYYRCFRECFPTPGRSLTWCTASCWTGCVGWSAGSRSSSSSSRASIGHWASNDLMNEF